MAYNPYITAAESTGVSSTTFALYARTGIAYYMYAIPVRTCKRRITISVISYRIECYWLTGLCGPTRL